MGSALQISCPGLKYMVVTYNLGSCVTLYRFWVFTKAPRFPTNLPAPQTHELSNQGSCLCIMRISLPQFGLNFYDAHDVIYY